MSEPGRCVHCPVIERTADGVLCGRCWHYLDAGVCPRHGNVSDAARVYETTGKLTPEPRATT
jgi:hypothetical protein